MVFMGRGRGRGTSQFVSKSGGAISATTRKEKRPTEIYEREDRNRSRSPMSKRPVLQRLGPPQPEEMTPSHESLRITVGNDIYKDQRPRSPLSDRLGPPVKKTDSYDDMKYHSDERYDQLYGGLSDDDRDTRKNNRRRDRYDSPHSPVRGSRDRGRRSPSYDRGRRSGSYDRGRRSPSYDRGRRSPSYDRRRRSPSYDRGRRSTSYDRGRRSTSYDREWKSSPYRNRDRRSTSRDRDRRDHDRGRRSSFDRSDVSDRKAPFEERTDRDREPYKREDYIPDDRRQNVQSELVNRYRIPETQTTHSYSGVYSAPSLYDITTPLQPSVTETGDNKPLKSILKKSALDPQTYTSDKTTPFPQNIQPGPFGTPVNPAIYGTPKAIGIIQKDVQKSQKSFSSLPGMSSYMDIEDEERFLYGDDGEEKSKMDSKGYYEGNKRNLSEFTQYKNMDRPSLTGSYSGAYRADERNLAQLQQQPHYPPYSDHQVPQTSQQQPRSDSKSDLLSMFTGQRGPTNPSASDPFSSQSQQKASPTEKKAKYDPTIENILKSIGFDFEMSKRMQEKANPTPFKPKEEMQYGIDQSSSFLGGEISDDIKKEIFPIKSRKESMVDVLLREAKLTSSPSDKLKPQRQDSFPSRERRDSVPKRDRSSYERESSYHDDKRDKQKPIPSNVPSSQPVSSSYTTPSTSYTPTVTYPVSSIQTTYGVTSTTASSYPASNTVSGYPYVPPPAAGYTGLPPSPYGMPPPGHPSLWGPPPGYPAYGVRYPYAPPPGYPASYQPYTTPQTTGSTTYKNTSTSSSSSSPKIKETVSKSKTHSNLKTVELSTKKLDDPPPRKAETKTVTVVKKVVKKSESKGRPKGNVVSSTTTSSNRTVIPPKVKTAVKRPADSKPPSNGNEKIVITKVILTTKEKDKLVKEKEQNQQRLNILEQELTSLRKQQNELMRKRRRQKDGHKDPILMQNSILQDEITKQIAKLREEAEEKAKFLNEATVEDAGSSTPKRSRESSSTQQSPMSSDSLAKKPRTDYSRSRPLDRKQSDRPKTETSKRKDDNRSKDRQRFDDRQSSNSRQSTEKPKEKSKVETQKQKTASIPASHEKDTYRPIKPVKKVKYEFFDPGNHWCKSCNVVCSSLISMLQHLHGKKHQGSVNKYERPWMPDELKSGVDKTVSKDDTKVEVCPIKGQEFFMATKGYYCTLCKEHSGDDISAEYHIKTESHYLKYKDYIKEHPFYEQRLNLDKAAGMSLMIDEEKRQEKKEEIKKEESKPDEKPKEKDPADEAKKLEQKKKMQAIWDKHIKSKQQGKTKTNKNKIAQSEEEKEKGKIQINILNKTGIKQAPPPIKKNPVLPPWTPVSKEQIIQPVRKPSVDNQEPPSLDDFITVGQNEKIPVVRDISKSIKLTTAKSLLKKISEKQVEKKDSEVVEKKKDIDHEEKKDLEMLAINPDESAPVAEIKLPPPPTQNLSLPTENKDNKMATSSSDEMYTLFFSDDKQVTISADDKEAAETKASDLVEIDAEANVTLLSDEENEKTKEDEAMEDVEKIPLPMNTDLVVISLDSHSEESNDENSHVEKDEESNENANNVDQVSNEIDDENVDKEKCPVEKEKDEPDLKMDDKLATSVSNDKKTETVEEIKDVEENLGTNQMEEIATTNDDVVTKDEDISATNEETTATNVEITATKEEIATTNVASIQEAAETIDANVTSTAKEVSSKIEVLPMTQNATKKGRWRSQRSAAKNVTEVAIVDENEGNPIEVVGVTKEKPVTETKTENTIQVIQTRRSSSRIQQTQSQKTSPTTIRTRELSNLHDIINVDDEVETNQSENVSPKKKKNVDGSSPTKKRTTRKSSTGNKIKSKTQSKYVPKKHLQVDIVSISDDEYENVDSASDFSENEQELENISSSSEKFETNISEHLENVSSDSSEIEDNDTNAELENISSDEMEGNIMTVDEVGEVDEFEDFDFHDEANVLDQVGDSDDDMEVHSNEKEQGLEKMDLENISDAEDGDFKKDEEDKIDGNSLHKGLEKSSTPDAIDKSTGKESTDDISKEEKLIEGDEKDLISKETEKDKDISEDMVTPVDEREAEIEAKLFVEKTLGTENIEQENLSLINNEQDTNTETIVEEKMEQTSSTQSTVETEGIRNKISIEDGGKSKTVTEDEITVNVNIDQTVQENLGDLSVETPLDNIDQTVQENLGDLSVETPLDNIDQTVQENLGDLSVVTPLDNIDQTVQENLGDLSVETPLDNIDQTVKENLGVLSVETPLDNIDQTVQENLGDSCVETPLDNVSKSDISSLDDSFQQEEDINVKSTARRRRGRGRGRGTTRKTPRRGRSSTKMQPECEIDEVPVCTEEKEEEMAIEIQEVLSTEDTDAQKTKSEENVEVVEVETKMKSPKRGRPSKKKQNEMEVLQESTSEEIGEVLANKSKELEITAEVLETKLQENEINIIVVEDTQNVNVEQETQKENEIQNNTEGEGTTGNILSLESGICCEVQDTQNNAKDYEVLHNEEKPEVINLDSDDEVIDTEDHKNQEISEISDKKLEESMEINENVDKNSSDMNEIIGAIPEQPSIEIENKTLKTDDEHQILIQDDNDDEKDVKISSGELSLDIAEYNSDDETDVLPLDMDEFINLDNSTELTQIIDGNKKEVVNSEEQGKTSSQKETLVVENQNRMIEQDINNEIDSLHTDNGGGDVISISDNESESNTDAQESQFEKPVCLELNMDSLETFNLSMKPEISVSNEPSIDSNKNGNDSDLFNLDFANKERLQLFQDDANSNSDNTSSSSEIKIDVVLEAIDSLSRIDTLGNNVSTSGTKVEDEPQAMEDEEIPIDTRDIIEDVSERIGEDVNSKDNEDAEFITIQKTDDSSQDEEDMVVVSSALEEGEETENPDFKNTDVDDCASNGSGISMDMGSDFEVLDECESD